MGKSKKEFGTAKKDTDFGRALVGALEEARAYRRGEIELPTQVIEFMPPERIKKIRKHLARSPREFERRYGVPARTLEGWEQGRKVDVTARVLLTVIEREPEAVERALARK